MLLVTESDRPGTAPTNSLKPEMVRTRPLPVYRHVNFTYHGTVETGHYTDFDELGPMQLKVCRARVDAVKFQLFKLGNMKFTTSTGHTSNAQTAGGDFQTTVYGSAPAQVLGLP